MELSIRKYQIAIIVSTFVLLIIGLYMVRDSSLVWANYLYGDENYYFKRQLIYAILGIVVFVFTMRIPFSALKKISPFALLVSLILLILVLIPGLGITKNGSTSWLVFSILSFQPSEFFKISLILFFSLYLEKFYYQSGKIRTLIPLFAITLLGFVLIMLQPDFGTCMVLAVSIFILLYASRLKNKWFLILIAAGLVAIGALIFFESYRFKRITAFLDPFSDPLGSGFQIIQSLYAIGPGGLIGNMSSIQKYYYLPEPQTDFIFAIYVEEFGLLGGIILIGLYAVIFYSSFKIIVRSTDLYKSFVSLGLLSLFMIQTIINLGVVIGLFPVTGITLPLVSYGGSSLIVVLFSLGLIVNHRYENTVG